MISAGSAIPSFSDCCDFPGARSIRLRRRWASPALVALACCLVQGCGNSETTAVGKPDAAMPSGSGKGDILLARAAIDSFADRYSAFESVAPRPARQTAGDRTGTISGSYKLAEAMPGLPFAERYPAADIFAPTFVFKRPAERAQPSSPPALYKLASLSPEVPYGRPVIKQAHTDLIGFDNSAFPYFGKNPRTGERFSQGGRYSDNRVLVHVPAGFDVRKPGVIVLFFHGHGATLQRDVRDRQLLPLQVSESGVNAVLVAPQLAYDAADSSAGKFWEPGGLKRFMAEAADRLARLYGDSRASEAFARMPVVIVAYSGGFVSAASCLQVGGLGSRIRGVVLLDALYGEMDKFSSWIVNNRSAFFVSAYTQYTRHRDDELARILRDKGVAVSHELNGPLQPGTVAFLPTEGVRHRDYVTLAWTEHPVKDILQRIPRR